MIKLVKYLRRSAAYIVLIMLLLLLQAYCDLSLPSYTSKIINVGVQQKGIEDNLPAQLRIATMEDLSLFLEKEQLEEILSAYSAEGIYQGCHYHSCRPEDQYDPACGSDPGAGRRKTGRKRNP